MNTDSAPENLTNIIEPSTKAPSLAQAERKAEYLKLYRQAVVVAEKTYPVTETTIEEEIMPLKHQRRVLAKQIGSLLIGQEKSHEEKLTQAIEEGETDPLTRALNRKGLNRRIVAEIGRIKRAEEEISRGGTGNTDSMIIYIDANGLKEINDNPKKGGHDAGDNLLRNIVLVLSETLRPIDTIARIGGDEFAVLLSGANSFGVKDLWEGRLLRKLEEKGISLSAGAAPLDPDNVDESFKRADRAMYRAKGASRITGGSELRLHGEDIR